MSYRQQADFDRTTVESVQRTRRNTIWVLPLVVLQQGWAMFRHDADFGSRLFGTAAWASVTVLILWWLLGLRFRWLPERDHAILNDEFNREISGDAARWGIAALALIGCGLMVARLWMALDAGLAIYALVNGALLVTVARYHRLNRGEPDEDE